MGSCGNCTAWQDGTYQVYQADPDIAGIGIISVYIGSAFITLCLEVVYLVLTSSGSKDTNSVDYLVYKLVRAMAPFKISDSKREFWIPIIEKLVLSLSDQQLLTGLAVLIASFWTHCSISVYHFALVNDLAWFSASVHVTTLSVLRQYLHDNTLLRDWRVALMTMLAFLLVASTIMAGHHQWFDSWPYDAQCLFSTLSGNIGGAPRYWMLVGLTLISINYPLSIIPLFDRPMEFVDKWLDKKPRAASDQAAKRLKENISHTTSPNLFNGRIRRFAYTLLLLIVRGITCAYFTLMSLIGSNICNLMLDIFWFAFSLWSIIGDRDIPSSEMNGDENAMTFGQIMPILLLSSVVLVFWEAYAEQTRETKGEWYDSAPSNSSQHSLVHPQGPAISAAPTASQGIEMTDAVQDTEDSTEPAFSRPRRMDTEMGGRSQTSGLEKAQLQRRSTFPPRADDPRLGSGDEYSTD